MFVFSPMVYLIWKMRIDHLQCLYMNMFVYLCEHVCVFMCTCLCIYVYMFVYLCEHVCVFMCTCLCIYDIDYATSIFSHFFPWYLLYFVCLNLPANRRTCIVQNRGISPKHVDIQNATLALSTILTKANMSTFKTPTLL